MAKSINDWMHEGEDLYTSSLKEYQEMEEQLQEMERRFVAKQHEVNQIAQIIGKPMVEGNRRLTAQLVEDRGLNNNLNNSPATIARALAGRHAGR